jgi:hypothetical protein
MAYGENLTESENVAVTPVILCIHGSLICVSLLLILVLLASLCSLYGSVLRKVGVIRLLFWGCNFLWKWYRFNTSVELRSREARALQYSHFAWMGWVFESVGTRSTIKVNSYCCDFWNKISRPSCLCGNEGNGIRHFLRVSAILWKRFGDVAVGLLILLFAVLDGDEGTALAPIGDCGPLSLYRAERKIPHFSGIETHVST